MCVPFGRVADGVLDEVERHAVELVAGAVDDRVVGVHREVMAVGDGPELGRHLDEHVADVGRLVRELAVGVGAGQQQQVAHEAAHALRGAQRRARRLAALAVEDVGQQLEVGEDRGQRRAQLVRGVGHELPLALQGALGLLLRRLERVEHGLQRPRELGHLVVGGRLGNRLRGVARALDVACGRGHARDREHRAAPEQDPAQQREERAGQDAAGEEEPDAPDRRLDVGDLAPVLQDHLHDDGAVVAVGVDDLDRALAHLDAQAVVLGVARGEDEAEVRRARRAVEDPAVGPQDPDGRVARRAEVAQVGPSGRALARGDVADERDAV